MDHFEEENLEEIAQNSTTKHYGLFKTRPEKCKDYFDYLINTTLPISGDILYYRTIDLEDKGKWKPIHKRLFTVVTCAKYLAYGLFTYALLK